VEKEPEPKRKPFTPKEDLFLVRSYGRVSWTELKARFPGRSSKSIIVHAEKVLGLKRSFPGSYPVVVKKRGWYWDFGYCTSHGKILKSKFVYNNRGGARCPICHQLLRLRPKKGRYRRKYLGQ